MARAKNASLANGTSFEQSKDKKWARRFGSNIRVGRRDYRLIFCESIHIENGQQIAGLCDPNNKTIYVDVTHDVEATLLHEVFHGELFESGFHQRGDWLVDNEEHIVECLSQAVAHSFTFRRKKA